MKIRNRLILIFYLFNTTLHAQSKTLLFVNTDTSYRYGYSSYDNNARNFDTLEMRCSKPDVDGFYNVTGGGLVKYLFGDKRIKVLDSSIVYKLPDSNKVFTYLDCKRLNAKEGFEVQIYSSFAERSYYSLNRSTPLIHYIDYTSSAKPVMKWCGKTHTVFEFEVFGASPEYPELIGFSPNHGIVYIGYTLPTPEPDQRWIRVCGKN